MSCKAAVVLGTRPEAIKLAPLILELEKRDDFDCITVLTAQHREMSDDVLRLFGIIPTHDLNLMQPGQSLFDLSVRLITGLRPVYEEERPDVVIVQGDTTTTFIASLAAYYLRIPVVHVEAGLRTADKHNPFPEEINRRLTSDLADLHFAPTETSEKALLAERVPAESIVVTGNTVIDALLHIVEKAPPSHYLPTGLDPDRRWILVTSHRRENWGAPLESICLALRDLCERYDDIEIIYPVHPNPRVLETTSKLLAEVPNIHLVAPLEYLSFVHLMNAAYFIITDSGGIQEEAPSLGKPVLVIRDKTERPEAVEAGTVRLVGTSRERIVEQATELLDSEATYNEMSRKHNPYGDGNACPRIADAILERWKSGTLARTNG
jgi:UDP-N-acetylglucosamine 2-epimerase (non-hydrolysing)